MNIHPTHSISSATGMDMINSGFPLVDAYIQGELKFDSGNKCNKMLVFRNCIIEYIEAIMVEFTEKVEFTNCHFKNAQFIFSYFCKGFIIENCSFDRDLDLSSGGHNEIGHPVLINNNSFSGFVNFFDCQFTGQISVTGNRFLSGTNISAKNQLLTFDFPAIIENNTGKLDDVEPTT
jgi:hypothetical protein